MATNSERTLFHSEDAASWIPSAPVVVAGFGTADWCGSYDCAFWTSGPFRRLLKLRLGGAEANGPQLSEPKSGGDNSLTDFGTRYAVQSSAPHLLNRRIER